MQYYRCIVSGKVQNVGYRKSVSLALMKKKIKGYIRNLDDGTVEAVAQLSDDILDIFHAILKKGSYLSRVENISCEVVKYTELETNSFEIRY